MLCFAAERMRSSYGKLVYFLQDTQMPEIQELLEFKCVRPLQTVHSYLEAKGLLDMLRSEHIETATRVITPEGT
jgi:hypothetical protein